MKLLFVSLDSSWTDLAKSKGYDTFCGKVQDYQVPHSVANIFYISPANSLGFMDGGIDKVYSQIMFPGIETKVKNNIAKLNQKTLLGRPFIPIGRAICTKTESMRPKGCCYLITAPTMLLPQKVPNTTNAFFAMISTLVCIEEMKKNGFNFNDNDMLVIPSMCCGWGGMPIDNSFMQIHTAIEDYDKLDKSKLDLKKILLTQPKYYENSEWFQIEPTEIIRS